MAFRREALEEIGGFDPIYRAAGDDVDVCWRLQNAATASASAPRRWSGTSGATRSRRTSSSSAATARPRRCSTSTTRTASTCSASRAGSAASTATSSSILSLRAARHLRRRLRPRAVPDALRAAVVPARRTCRSRSSGTRRRWPLGLAVAHGGPGLARRAAARVDVGGVPGRRRSAPGSTRAAPAWRGRALIALLTYLGPLLRCLERYRWWARGLSAGGARRRLGRQRPASRVLARARVLRLVLDGERRSRRRRSSTVSWHEVLAARKYFVRGRPGLERLGPRGAGRGLGAGPRDGRHRVPRRRAAGAPRPDARCALSLVDPASALAARRRSPRAVGVELGQPALVAVGGSGRRCSPPAPSRARP